MSSNAFDQIVRDELRDENLKEIHRQELADERQSAEYRYAMVFRPVGIGTIPRDGFLRAEPRPAVGEDHHAYARNGVAVFSRKLSDEETIAFEMAYMPGHHELKPIAAAVSAEMAKYAHEYRIIAESDSDEFERTVSRFIVETAKGFRPSVGNITEFSSMVLELLSAGHDDSTQPQPERGD